MYDYEIIELEEKAKTIVETLSQLEEEVKKQQKANEDTRIALNAFKNLTNTLNNATDEVRDFARLLNRSSTTIEFSKLNENFEALIQQQSETQELIRNLETTLNQLKKELVEQAALFATKIEEATRQRTEELETVIKKIDSDRKRADAKLEADLKNTLSAIEERIGRIDRNTQKGFGKERSNS